MRRERNPAATYGGRFSTPPALLPFCQGVDDDIGRVGNERDNHSRGEVVEEQLAKGAEVQPLPPQSLLLLLPLLGRPREGFPTRSRHHGADGLR